MFLPLFIFASTLRLDISAADHGHVNGGLGSCARWNRNAATATAPLGSASVLGLAESRRVASWISSSLTVTMSSTY